jgi:regulator of replication initiation timing
MKFFTESDDFTLDEIDADIVELFFINGNRSEEVLGVYKKVKAFYENLKKIIEDNKSNLEPSEFRTRLRKFVNNFKWAES